MSRPSVNCSLDAMRTLARTLALLSFVPVAACGGGGGGGDGGGPPTLTPRRAILHIATAGNIDGASTEIYHPEINGDPTAPIVVTHVLDDDFGAVENVHPIGVSYLASTGRWSIVNEDLAPMPVGAAFYVTRAPPDVVSLLHSATAGNTALNVTRIDDASAGDAAATLLVTQHLNAAGPVVFNPAEIGVYRHSGTWRIFNQDDADDMPVGADFIVLRPTTNNFIHHATVDNSVLDFTYVGHVLLNDDPAAVPHVTQNWNPDDAGFYNDHTIAVHYREAEGLWTIVNVDGSAIPVGASFNVWVR